MGAPRKTINSAGCSVKKTFGAGGAPAGGGTCFRTPSQFCPLGSLAISAGSLVVAVQGPEGSLDFSHVLPLRRKYSLPSLKRSQFVFTTYLRLVPSLGTRTGLPSTIRTIAGVVLAKIVGTCVLTAAALTGSFTFSRLAIMWLSETLNVMVG